jgi:hypothetical protein
MRISRLGGGERYLCFEKLNDPARSRQDQRPRRREAVAKNRGDKPAVLETWHDAAPSLLQSATHLTLESFQKALATIRATGARLERGFADFADFPYQDARTQQELSRLFDEC